MHPTPGCPSTISCTCDRNDHFTCGINAVGYVRVIARERGVERFILDNDTLRVFGQLRFDACPAA